MGRLIASYIDDREAAGIASTSRQRDAWKAMKPYWEEVNPGLVDEEMAKGYAAQRRAGAATVRYELSMLSVAMRWAAAPPRNFIAQAPDVWRPAAPDRIERHLTKAQFSKFLDACRAPHVRLYCILAVTTAARPTALLELTWDRVDLENAMANLNPVGRIQTAKRRPRVPLNDVAVDALKGAYRARQSAFVIERGGAKIACIKKGFQAASARCGMKVTPYMIRHTAAVWMAEARVPMSEIAQYLGHDDSRTTEKHYARYSPGFLRQAASALTW